MSVPNSNADPAWDLVEARRAEYEGLADRVFDTPEICYEETRSVAEHRAMLQAEGFRITDNAAGIPTAIVGEAGEGGPVIAILGEFDALPALSQQSGVATPAPIEDGGAGHGHGCGHNLLGSAALAAAAAIKDFLAENGIAGRVRYYGCPAEEGGAAKVFMVRAGLFDDVDAAISWHPSSYTGVFEPNSLANTRIDFTFHGKAAHAAASPELGRSALDAVELMNVGVNYLREHMPADAKVHYAYLDAGGVAPNVVQARATVRQLVRAKDLSGMRSLLARVKKIAEGAALMTETRVESDVASAVSNILSNRPLEELMQAHLDRLGAPAFDADDRAFARDIRKTLTRDDIAAVFSNIGQAPDFDMELCDFVAPLDRQGDGATGSTDVGDVSWAVPTVQAWVTTCALGTPFHTWQMTAHGKTGIAHKGMIHAAKAMAAVGCDLFRRPEVLAAAKAEHAAHLAREAYVCPIPGDVLPPIPGEDR